MAKELYCWRCKRDMPMLNEVEWARIVPSLAEAHDPGARNVAIELYHAMTGVKETNINAIWHHRASLYGPPCKDCGKPLRTPGAKLCIACGAHR